MAPPNFLSGAAFVRLYWDLNGELAVNVLGAGVTGTVTFGQALAETLGAAIKAAYTAQLAVNQNPNTSLVRVGVRDWRTPNQMEYRDTGAAVPGTGTADALPRGTAMCITMRTAKSGKSFTGRVYLPGFTEQHNDAAGTIGMGLGSAGVAFMNAVSSAMGSNGLPLSIISRPSERTVTVRTTYHNDGTQSSDTISEQNARQGAVTPVTAFESRNTRWEYQRRRDNGRNTGAVSLMTPVARAVVGEVIEAPRRR